MTFLLLIRSLSSDLPGLRQLILDIAPGIGFLGHPFPCRIRLTPALPCMAESLQGVTPFRMLVFRCLRIVLFTGFHEGEHWSG